MNYENINKMSENSIQSNNQGKEKLIYKNKSIYACSPDLHVKKHKASIFQLINIPFNNEDNYFSNLINSEKIEIKGKKLHKFFSFRNYFNKLANKIKFNLTQTSKRDKIKNKALNLKTIFN